MSRGTIRVCTGVHGSENILIAARRHLRPRKRPSLWRQVHSVQLHISRWSSPKGGFFARCVNLKAALRSCAKQGILPKVDLCNLSVENPQGLKKQLNDLSNSFTLGNTPGDRTCTHHVRDRCPICFGNLLLSCSDVFGSQIGSTESGNPVWTYENRCRPIWAPSYGSFIGRQRAWRTCTTVHVRMYGNQPP